MNYEKVERKIIEDHGAEKSTMMGSPCLRYQGRFFSMIFEKENALVLKLKEHRVNELVACGLGREFNFTKKRFKEWILIPNNEETKYEELMIEALNYAKGI